MPSPTVILENNHITIPAGIAITADLLNTYNVLSNTDLTITFPICGFLYGGNSNIKFEGTPFNIVFDKILEIISVTKTPNIIVIVTVIAEIKLPLIPTAKPPNKYRCYRNKHRKPSITRHKHIC